MPRNDGIDRVVARNRDLTASSVIHAQAHNEREKDAYSNPDIVTAVSHRNIHFKKPDANYQEIFDRLECEKTISTRGLKKDAVHFCELIFDVNSAYFHNRGGYEFARQFYADAYKAAVEIVGGEAYIVSAVMHADERNSGISDSLGQDVFHYHLHVVYIPVVEKQILWTKRCKDPALIGTVKETVMQVSRSKKWASKPALDEAGNPIQKKNGKPQLIQSYSILQDQFFEAMRAAGYDDIQRGQRGSTEQHLSITQFKVKAEQKRLDEIITEQEAVTDLIDELKFEKQDIERQTQAAEEILNEILPDLEQVEQLEKEIPVDPEAVLPPGKTLESAKSYRERIKPIWTKLVQKLQSFLKLILQLKHEIQELRSQTRSLHSENAWLRGQIDNLKQERRGLLETVRDFARAKKILGEDTIAKALAADKESEMTAPPQKPRNRDFSR